MTDNTVVYETISGFPVTFAMAKKLFKCCPTFAYNPEVFIYQEQEANKEKEK